jgi:hypothetical protein
VRFMLLRLGLCLSVLVIRSAFNFQLSGTIVLQVCLYHCL